LRALAANDDGELAPGNVLLDVDTPQLACDAGVLLRRVRRRPGGPVDGRRPMRRRELEFCGPEGVREPSHREVGESLEGEDMRTEVAGGDERAWAEPVQERLGPDGGVLNIVDHNVVEHRLAALGGCRRLLDESGEIDLTLPVEDLQVAPEERRQLEPSR
jgi:hypothetical protein